MFDGKAIPVKNLSGAWPYTQKIDKSRKAYKGKHSYFITKIRKKWP